MSDSCNPMDCSLPDSSVHGILHARILEWVAISFHNSVKIKKQPQQKPKKRYRRQRGCRGQVTELFGHSKLPITGKIFFFFKYEWKSFRHFRDSYIQKRRRQWHLTPVLLPGKSHGRRNLVGCSPWGRWESDTTERLHFHFSLSCIGEGNGSPLQCSCLENPRDGGAWWAAVYRVSQWDTTEAT